MRVGIFATMAGRQAGGTETYERSLVSALARLDSANDYVVFATSPESEAALRQEAANLEVRVLRPGIRPVSVGITMPWVSRRSGLDVLHATFAAPPFPPRPMVFTMHCMSQFARPDFYPWFMRWRVNPLVRIGLRRAALTICVSNDIRDRVREQFGIPDDRLVTIYNGIDERFRPIPDDEALRGRLRERYGIDAPYLLFAGKLEARKNILGLLRAFALLKRETRAPHRLVLAGRPNWASQGIDGTIRGLGLEREVVRTGHLPLGELPALYSAADAFVFPSFFEGFGIPPIEAMACGAPTIVADNSAMPEVAGGAALLVDPHRDEDIAAAMHRVLSEPALRAELRRKGLERARLFSWEATARQTLEAYARVSRH